MSRLSVPIQTLSERPARLLRGASSSTSTALIRAWHDSLDLLVRPFDTRRWVKLSVVCLVLGGGTPTAALNGVLGILPKNIQARALAAKVEGYAAQHAWLFFPALLLFLFIALGLLFLRAAGRFILVDAVARKEIRVRRAWKWNRRVTQSYFWFLLGLLTLIGSVLGAMFLGSFSYLQSSASRPSWTLSLTLVFLLGSVILVGILSALAITLTDDFVVPIMYVERVSLGQAWRELARLMRKDPAAFVLYVLVRIGLAILIGAAVLFLLFPALLAIFSGGVLAGSLVFLSLRAVGAVWTWNAATLTLTLVAAAIFSSVLLVALSVAGMPGQVFLQNFAIRFISMRFPSLAHFLDAQAGDASSQTPQVA